MRRGVIPRGGGVDIFISSVAFAAWFGLFVTAMNLLPVGQLDGGHIIYCLLGEKARWLGTVLVGAMMLAGIFWWSGWLLWAVLVFFVIGPGHPPPLNDLVPLFAGHFFSGLNHFIPGACSDCGCHFLSS